MLVDQSSILTEGNEDWEFFVALATINCAMQYRYGRHICHSKDVEVEKR